MKLKELVGGGDRIGLFVLPFVVVGVLLNVALPSAFDVGGPSDALRAISIVVLLAGVTIGSGRSCSSSPRFRVES